MFLRKPRAELYLAMLLLLSARLAHAAQEDTLLFSATLLSFRHQVGGAEPAVQELAVASSGKDLAFTASVVTAAREDWLLLDPRQGVTPAALTVSVDPAGLPPGNYLSYIRIASQDASNRSTVIPVSLVVTAGSQPVVEPPSLTFRCQSGAEPSYPQAFFVSSTGSPLAFTVSGTTSAGEWLAISPATGTTPATISVTVNPENLAPGFYTGSVEISVPGAETGAVSVPVTVLVSSDPVLTVTPERLQFLYQIGGPPPARQILSFSSSGAPLHFTLTAATSSGAGWLEPPPAEGAAPGSIGIGVNPAGLPAGNYEGAITVVTDGFAPAAQTIPVLLTVAAGPGLRVSPGLLNFSAQAAVPSPAKQVVAVTSTGANVSFSVSTETIEAANWLLVGPVEAITPATLTAAVDSAGLAPGIYHGLIRLLSWEAGNTSQTIPVTLAVSDHALLTVSPAMLSFAFRIGAEIPADLIVSLGSTSASLRYQASVATASGGSWLIASPLAGAAPGVLRVGVNPSGLEPGEYLGWIEITSGEDDRISVPVSLTVSRGNDGRRP